MKAVASRPLGAFERAQHITGERQALNLVVVVRLSGELSHDALERAIGELQREHPLLRCRIGRSGGRPLFELFDGVPAAPFRALDRAGEEDWRQVAEAELARPVEPERAPLFRCSVLSAAAPTRHDLIFTFHHAIADARAVSIFLDDLLARTCGPPREAAWSSSIPPSSDDRLPEAYRGWRGGTAALRFLARQMANEADYRRRTRGRRPRPPAGDFRCRVLPIVFDEEETGALVRATRRHRVGVGSVLNAAMLLAVVGRRRSGSPLPHRYFVFPLLRPYLEPPIGDSVFASYFSTLLLTTRVDAGGGLWELAAAIHRQTDRAAKRGERFLAMRWSPLLMRSLLAQKSSRMATVALNYAGAVELEPPGGAALRVEALHAFVSNFPLGPEYTAQARVFQRRLWLDVLYLDSDLSAEEARSIAEEVRRLLETAE